MFISLEVMKLENSAGSNTAVLWEAWVFPANLFRLVVPTW